MSRQSQLITKESGWMQTTMPVLFLTILTGYLTFFVPGTEAWEQITTLFHLIFALYISICFIPYIVIHFIRVVGIRKSLVVLSGGISLTVLLILIVTGLHITIIGQREVLRWITQLHVMAAHVTLITLGLHLLIHYYNRSVGNRRKSAAAQFNYRKTFRYCLISTAITALTIASISYSVEPGSTNFTLEKKNYSLPYGNHPFRPSQTETDSQQFIAVNQIAGSSRCIECHQDISRQWLSSMHSQAASDKAYEKNIGLLVKNKGIEAARYCEGCHAPIALLTGELTPGSQHGGIKDTAANLEGVSCLSCHQTDRVTNTRGVASFHYGTRKYYLFSTSNSKILQSVNRLLIKINPELHRNNMGNPVLKTSEFCASCHIQFMDKDMNNWGWIKMQDEYHSWVNSPYSGQSSDSFSKESITRCQDCHMPLINSNDPSATAQNTIRSHKWLGANTAIPFITGNKNHLNETIRFLQADKVRINIEKPSREDAERDTQYSNATHSSNTDTPFYLYLNESMTLKVAITNNGVGHDFPGGTTDINQVWIHTRVVDASGELVFESGAIDESGFVDDKAIFYHSTPINRHGHPVWKHDLFNMTGETYKRVIEPKETDTTSYSFGVQSWVKSPLTVSATLKYRKFNQRYANWALEDKANNLPIVNMSFDSLVIPVKIKKPTLQINKTKN